MLFYHVCCSIIMIEANRLAKSEGKHFIALKHLSFVNHLRLRQITSKIKMKGKTYGTYKRDSSR